MLLGASLVSLSSVLLITTAGSAGTVIGLMALNGLGAGVASPSLSTVLARHVATGRQGTAFGVFTSAPQVAAVAAGLALPLIAEPLDWRVTFLFPAAIGAGCATALVRRGLPADHGRPAASRLDRRKLPRSVPVIALSAALVSAAGIGMRTFLVVFAVSVGFASSTAGLLLAVTGLVAIVSRVGFGALGDRRPGRALNRAAALMSLCAIGFVLMALGGHAAIVIGALLAGGVGWGWQAPLSHAVVAQNPTATSAAVGMQMTGFFGGAVAGPLAVGLLAEGDSYGLAWAVFAGLSLVAAALAVLADRLAGGARPVDPRLSKVGQT